MKTTKTKKTTKISKQESDRKKQFNLKKAAREYLQSKVGLISSNTEFFMYLLEDPTLSKLVPLFENGKIENLDSKNVISVYLKRLAQLREKVETVADMCVIDDEDNRVCFIEETMAKRERFEPIDKVDLAKLKEYVKKVNEGMSVETAIKKLKLNINMLNYVTIRPSNYWED